MYETIHTTEAAGFDIVFSVTYENDPPDWDFESEEDKQDTLPGLITVIWSGLLRVFKPLKMALN
jgi:hypothetical protein